MNIKDLFEKRLKDETISDDWRESFYHIASAILSDVIIASRGDELIAANAATRYDLKESKNALRRLSKIEDVLATKMPPGIRRAAEIHVIINRLRYVAVPVDQIEEVVVDNKVKFVCLVSEGEPSVPVELVEEPSSTAHPALKQMYAQLQAQEWFEELRVGAKKHWSPQATLQSLAVNIYLDRYGHVEENNRAQWREKLFRDLRDMRRAKLTIKEIDPFGKCKNHPDICTPGKNTP